MRSVFLNRSLTHSLTLLTLSVFSIKMAIGGDMLPETSDQASVDVGSPPVYKGKGLLPLSPPISPMESLPYTPPWPCISPSVLSPDNQDREGAGYETVSTKVALKPPFPTVQHRPRLSAPGAMITEEVLNGWRKRERRGPSLPVLRQDLLDEMTKGMFIRDCLTRAELISEGKDEQVAELIKLISPYLLIKPALPALAEEGEQGDGRDDREMLEVKMAKLEFSEEIEDVLERAGENPPSAGCRKADEDVDIEMDDPVIKEIEDVSKELSEMIVKAAAFNVDLCRIDPPQGEEVTEAHKQLLHTLKSKISVLNGIWAGWSEKVRGSTFKDARGPFRARPFYTHV